LVFPAAKSIEIDVTAGRHFLFTGVLLAASTTYTAKVNCEIISGSIRLDELLTITGAGTLAGYLVNGVTAANTDILPVGNYLLEIKRNSGAGGSSNLRVGLGCLTAVTGVARFELPQFEAGAFSSPFILTPVGASATRNASVAVINDIDESEWWNPNQWQVDIQYITNRAGNNSVTPFEFYTDANNRFSPYHLTSGRIAFISRNAGVNSLLTNTTLPIVAAGDLVDLRIRYDGSRLYLSYNGSAEISYAVTLASVDKLILGVNNSLLSAACISGHIAKLLFTPSAGV
jgi:hypothetical protein